MCKTFQISLPNEEIVVFVVSTTGQGDIPDSMKVKSVPLILKYIALFCKKILFHYFQHVIFSKFVIFFKFFLFQVFWRFLLQRNLSQSWLEGVNYAVFGLGDSSYQKYNVMISTVLILWYFFLSN